MLLDMRKILMLLLELSLKAIYHGALHGVNPLKIFLRPLSKVPPLDMKYHESTVNIIQLYNLARLRH